MQDSDSATAEHDGIVLSLQRDVEFSSMFGMDSARLFGGVEARCVTLHPRQATVAVVRVGPLKVQ